MNFNQANIYQMVNKHILERHMETDLDHCKPHGVHLLHSNIVYRRNETVCDYAYTVFIYYHNNLPYLSKISRNIENEMNFIKMK